MGAEDDRQAGAYRHSPSFSSDSFALATWLRFGEIQAEQKECPDYSPKAFRQALKDIRKLTASKSMKIDDAVRLCSESGVVLALVKPFPGTAVSGASWWVTPRKPVIQLSGRHLSDDHLWFSMFHEAAHLLHSKNEIFLHGKEKEASDSSIEVAANDWAADFLVPRRDWDRFTAATRFTETAVRRFADDQGIAPGIVVGRLQHEGRLAWGSGLNRLKKRFKWAE